MSDRTSDLTEIAAGRTEHPFRMWDGIEQVPVVVDRCLGGEVAAAASRLAGQIRDRGIRRVHLFGCGTSYFAATGIAYALGELASIDADAYNAFEFGRYRTRSITPNSLVVAISHSGHTRVDVEAIEAARKAGAVTACFTDVTDSPLARASDLVVPGAGGRDPALPKTRSYQAALVKGYLAAVNISRNDDAAAELRAIPGLLRDAFDLAPTMKELASTFAGHERIVTVGGGPNAQTAFEVALKFKEAALVAAEGLEIEEAIHGPVVTLDERTLLVVLSTPGPSYKKLADLCRAALVIGCPVINVTTAPYDLEGVVSVHVESRNLREVFTPPLLAYPLQMMVYWMAIARGINPDVIRTNVPKYKDAMQIVMPPGAH